MSVTKFVSKNRHNIIKNHLIIIVLFIIFTGLFTYPSYFMFDTKVGNILGDSASWQNPFWWYQHNIENPPDPWNLDWLFYNDYQFYPKGAPINEYGMLSAWSTIPLMPLFDYDIVKVYNLLLYFSFIFTGYGTFLLAYHLTKNYYVAIIVGGVFTFGFYQNYHGNGHLSLLMLQFVPFATLYLIKLVEKRNITYPIIAGVFLFLTFSFSLYIGFVMVFFLIAFFLHLLYRRVDFHTFLRFGLAVVLGCALTFPIYYGHYVAAGESQPNSIEEFIKHSGDLTSYFSPTKRHLLYKAIDFPISPLTIATNNFLGYTVMALALFALLKVDKEKKSLWIFSSVLIAIVSFGPILKVFGYDTQIPMLYYLFYELPYFEVFRALGRAGVLVNFSVAILAGYGLNEIFKIKSISRNKKFVIIGIISVLIVSELLVVPLRTNDTVTIPDIYYTIGEDPEFYAILEAPIGRYAAGNVEHLETNHHTVFDQMIHGKPMYSGLMPRIPVENEGYVKTYFLNQFIWHEPREDIVKQNVNEVGISLFNHFNIGYVIVRDSIQTSNPNNEPIKNIWYPEMTKTLQEIFSKDPDYLFNWEYRGKDYEIFAYKVPKTESSTPFIALGEEWTAYLNFYRTIPDIGTIYLGNPSQITKDVTLEIQLVSPTKNIVEFQLNDKLQFNETLEPMQTYLIKINLELEPGVNALKVISNTTSNSIVTAPHTFMLVTNENEVGIAVNHISLNFNINETSIEKLEDNSFAEVLDNYNRINNNFQNILNRGATEKELIVLSERIMDDEDYPLEDFLRNTKGYKNLENKKWYKP